MGVSAVKFDAKTCTQTRENTKEVPRDQREILLENRTPPQKEINAFVGRYNFEFEKRVHMRDAISYAQSIKGGGWKVPARAGGYASAINVLTKWNMKKSDAIRLTVPQVEAVVELVYSSENL